jgi:ApeA-like protein
VGIGVLVKRSGVLASDHGKLDLGREWKEDARFWLPGDREHLCYGYLRYAPDRGPEVHVMDAPLVPGFGQPPMTEIALFHGETLGGQPFTLLDGFLTNVSEMFGGGGPGGSIADALFATLVRGAHANGIDDVRGGEAIVEMDGLLDLLIGGKVGQALLRVTAEKDSHDQIAFDLPFGTLILRAGAGGSFSPTERKHSLGASASVRLDDELLLSQIDRLLGPLRDLIVFATREPSFISDLVLLPPKTTRPESSKPSGTRASSA